MIVLDASVLVALLLRTPAAARVEAAIFDSGRPLHAPHLVDVEVASAFRRLASRGEIEDARGGSMLALLHDLPIERHAHLSFLPRVWQLRDTVTAYDATYVALAETLGATLLTGNAKLARSVETLVEVELI